VDELLADTERAAAHVQLLLPPGQPSAPSVGGRGASSHGQRDSGRGGRAGASSHRVHGGRVPLVLVPDPPGDGGGAAGAAAALHVDVELHALRSGLARLRAEVAGARRDSLAMAGQLSAAADGARRAALYKRVAEDATVKLQRLMAHVHDRGPASNGAVVAMRQ